MVTLAVEASPGLVRVRVAATLGAVDGQREVEVQRQVARERDHPGGGHCEVAPESLWRTTTGLIADLLEAEPTLARRLGAVEVAGDPHGLVVWDAETLGMPRPAICGDDERAAEGPPIGWVREHDPHCWALVEEGRHLLGGPAAYLLSRMTRGTWHLTDSAWAAATGLLDPATGSWSQERADRCGVPLLALPQLTPPNGLGARTDPRVLRGLDVPVRLWTPDALSSRT